ncbi:hypothetical protein GCM10011348_12930 [Marinobacterium nitratireducens]|uniref:DUF2783 domain-containing protein n=1 Tax=Marinobacterium nitratireducens TaxID=518897 RepID=A0A918DQW3_9GAMM|nr:DUF2783 domain-containing protein [Marinobacterium nitratireducens]GGO79214.1 hypothetical protein GCM10011348_12930 [Marinobacterium nitratireducens]
MTTATLSVQDLERVYDTLAESIDAVGTEHEALFLTKLALLSAREIGDAERVQALIATALKDL